MVTIFAADSPVTVAAGLVVVISGDTTATGVLLVTDADTRGAATDETAGVPAMTAVPLTTPAVVTLGAADLDTCVNEDGVDSAAVALAILTVACTGVGVDIVAVGLVMAVVPATVVLTDSALVVAVAVDKLGLTADVTASGT